MSEDTSNTHPKAGLNPDKKIPLILATGLGIQLSGLVIPGLVIMPIVVFRAAEQAESVMLWAVSASLMICGLVSILQAIRVGRIGAGYILVTGTSGASLAICIAALNEGGTALLAVLMLVLALFQIVFSTQLSLFRRILTPAIMGTVLMLTPVTVMPIIFDQLENVPAGAPPYAAPLSSLITILVIVAMVLKTKGKLRLWAPVIGIILGSAFSGVFGLYDIDRIAKSSWFGFPKMHWPGLDLSFGPAFWGLLPAFLFISIVCTIQTISGSIAVQGVSWPSPRSADFRKTQGAIAADGIGNILSGIFGAIPIGFRPYGTSMIELTGISSRRIGVAYGIVIIALAFFPKGLAMILAIPGPVTAAFITIMMATIFIIGIRIVVQDGIDYRKGLIVGVSFWVGVGFQNGVVFSDYISEHIGPYLNNGMVAGGLTAILLVLFVDLTKPVSSRIEVELALTSLKDIRVFLSTFAQKNGWDKHMTERLNAAAEETLMSLQQNDEAREESKKRLFLSARKEDGGAILEFVSLMGSGNLQDRLAMLDDQVQEETIGREVSLRLLRHFSSWVRHQKYHDTDIITMRIENTDTSPYKKTWN